MVPLTLFLLACAAVYLGTIEAAFSALMRLSLRLVADRGGRAGSLARYLDDPLLLFVPVRLLLGVILGLSTLLLARLTGVEGALAIGLLVVLTMTFGLVFEQLVPSLIARRDPERVLDVLLPSFDVALGPILRPITHGLVDLLWDARRSRSASVPVTPGEPDEEGVEPPVNYVAPAESERRSERDEHRLIRSIMKFGDTLVREVMTPRPDVVAIRSDASSGELRALFIEQEYSRIPVYKGNLDNIVGIVFVKDLIQLRGDGPIADFMRPAYFVPETKRVAELLKEFQQQQIQTAVVLDEYGGTAGLASLEDLLEEIVGEIRDEYDVESEPVVDEGGGVFVFSGKVDVDQVIERLGVAIEREGFETVGGYLLSHLGRVPAVGERFDIDGVSVEVLEAERRRVNKVRIRKRVDVEETADVRAKE